MKNSIEQELKSHVIDRINDQVLTDDNREEWHFHSFNEDHYLIGYFQCSEWLKKHNIGEFEAANTCVQYEVDNFGECTKEYNNSEVVVNMLAYIYGEELFNDTEAETVEELREAMEA